MLASRVGAIPESTMGAGGALFTVSEFNVFEGYRPIAVGKASCAVYDMRRVVMLKPARFVSEIVFALIFGLTAIVRSCERRFSEK